MKKFMISISLCIIMAFFCVSPLFAFAAPIVQSQISEPIETDNCKYFVIYNSDGTVGRIYAFYFVSGYGSDRFEPIFYINNSTGNWEYTVHYTNSEGIYPTNTYYFLFQYDLFDGHFYYSYDRTIDVDYSTSFNKSNYKYYLTYGVSVLQEDNSSTSNYYPALGSVRWNDTIDYTSDLAAIRQLLTQSNINTNNINSILHTISTQDYNFFQFFTQTYYNYVYGAWNLTNNTLNDIYEILGGNQSQPTQEVDSSFSSDIDDYVSEEANNLDNYEDALSDFDDEIIGLDNSFVTYQNGFAFVKLLFENFLLNQSLPYTLILFSVMFGIIAVVIGRRIHG